MKGPFLKQYKTTIVSALTLSCAMLGDTLLYPVLPVYYNEMHVPVMWIGFLLSINRYLRLLLNPWIVSLSGLFTLRKLTIAAAVLAVVSTLMYGLANELYLWFISRTLWAFSFAVLRISTSMYALAGTPRYGLNLGLSRGLQEAGPLLILIVGPLCLSYMAVSTVFLISGAVSIAAVILAYQLPDILTEGQNTILPVRFIPSSFNFLTCVSSLAVEGMLVVSLGTLFGNTFISMGELVAIASAYLLIRKLSVLVVSPLAGSLVGRYGIHLVFACSILMTIVALLAIASGIILIGVSLAFGANGVTSALAPAGGGSEKPNRLQIVAVNGNWRDLGAASGTLIGGIFIGTEHIYSLFFITTFVMTLALFFHVKHARLHFSRIGLWK